MFAPSRNHQRNVQPASMCRCHWVNDWHCASHLILKLLRYEEVFAVGIPNLFMFPIQGGRSFSLCLSKSRSYSFLFTLLYTRISHGERCFLAHVSTNVSYLSFSIFIRFIQCFNYNCILTNIFQVQYVIRTKLLYHDRTIICHLVILISHHMTTEIMVTIIT